MNISTMKITRLVCITSDALNARTALLVPTTPHIQITLELRSDHTTTDDCPKSLDPTSCNSESIISGDYVELLKYEI